MSLAGLTAFVSPLKGVAARKVGDEETGASILASPPLHVE